MTERKIELSGGTVTVSAVPLFPVLEYTSEWERNHPPPEPPTKEVGTIESRLGGEPDEKPLKEGAEYLKHLAAEKRWEYDRNMAFNAVVAVWALKDHYPVPEDESWAEDMKKLLKLEVPDREEDLLGYSFLYYQFTLMPTTDDLIALVRTVSEMSFASEERIKAKMRGFPLSGLASRLKRWIFRKG